MNIHRNPGVGSAPVEESEVKFIDVTEDGLSLGRFPNGQNVKFMDYIVEEVNRLMAQNEREPPTPEFEISCQKLQMRHNKSIT